MKIAVLPGDGIGPEIVAQAVKVLEALRGDGLKIEMEQAPVGGAGYDAARRSAAGSHAGAGAQGRCGAARRRGRPEVRRAAAADAPGAGAAAACARSWGCSPICARRCSIPNWPALRRCKPEIVAGLDIMILRELTGDIYFGQPRGRRQTAAASAKASTPCSTASRRSARIAHVGFQIGAQAQPQAVLGGQGQRAGHQHSVARGGERGGASDYPGRRAVPHVRGQRGHAAGACAQAVRRDRHRQHVRRYPVRRGVDADRLDRHAAIGFARRAQQGLVRADPRLGARHRRQGHGESAGDHSFRWR